MKLENQVISLEIAKKLKELGVKQESLFNWVDIYTYLPYQPDVKGNKPRVIYGEELKNDFSHADVVCSAFTVAELGEMLPNGASSYVGSHQVETGKKNWVTRWQDRLDEWDGSSEKFADTEADARGKMLIYLLENKLL